MGDHRRFQEESINGALFAPVSAALSLRELPGTMPVDPSGIAMWKKQPRSGLWWKAGLAMTVLCVAGCGRQSPGTGEVTESTPTPQPSITPKLGFRSMEPGTEAKQRPVSEVLADMAMANGDEAKATLAAAYSARLSRDELIQSIRDLQAQPGSMQEVVLRAMLKQLASHAPSVALQLALEKDPQAANDGLAAMVAEQWAGTDYAGLYDYSRTLTSDLLKYRVGAYAAFAWASRDPTAAFQYFSGLSMRDGGGFIGIAASELAKRDPNAALEALDKIQNDQVWDRAAGKITEVIAQQAPDQAIALLFDQDDPKAAAPIANALGSVMAESSAAAGIGVLNRLEDPRVAYSFLFGMLGKLREGDVSEFAANFSQIKNENVRAMAARSMARDVARRDPNEALAWAAALTNDEQSRRMAYQGAASGYAANNPQAAARWFETLPQGAERESAIYGFVEQYQWRQPADSANWALKITNAEARQRYLSSVLANWSRRDAEAARTWATQTGNLQFLQTRN
ncbi:hypothetical protein TSACC_21993 [Terrimicrobium sacchariphilum]|uniref:Uncharacterized protein n=1 Tax=Terrimicrobium sacchariphilum TaxID=690879 RepID=A0A146GAH2_TERSA|nr:hypothetical protein [Terrimicrobium sacchariphilum]GAT33576.1 hypothetical protein TSACC_21993 [Terrimicrobium sacchariphilum]